MSKKYRFNKLKKDKKGISLIEVIIVMAIAGLTLLALFNLTVHDISVEIQNEEFAMANNAMVTWESELTSIIMQNPGCLNALAVNGGSHHYFVCSTSSNVYNSPSIPISAACDANTNATQQFSISDQFSGNLNPSYTYVDPSNVFNCTSSNPSTNNVSYQANLNVDSVTNSPNEIFISFNSLITGANGKTYNLSTKEEFPW